MKTKERMIFDTTPDFEKDLKSLKKKYRTLDDDLGVFKSALKVDPRNLVGVVRIPLGEKIKPEVFKARKFRCKSLRGKGSKSGIRVIYAYIPEENKVIFVEIYHKRNKSNHDIKRIEGYFKS